MKYVWLFGENEAKTANNNSYYFWKYIVNRYYDVDAYFVLEKSKKNLETFHTFTAAERKHIVWRNSLKHYNVFFHSDLLFVTLSFKDVQPQKLLFKSFVPNITQPLVYLQHGTLGIKKIDYAKNYANNSMVRFFYYNPNIAQKLINMNGFREYQLYNGKYLPRYWRLVEKANNVKPHNLKILWFMTWREYFGNNPETDLFLSDISNILSNNSLQEYLRHKNATMTVCLHPFFTNEQASRVQTAVSESKHIKLVTPSQIDVMDELAENDVLITDYSSVGYDFTFLKKPVLLYQNNVETEIYRRKREFYCSDEELDAVSIKNGDELIDCLIHENYGINPFFAKGIDTSMDYDAIENGEHIERMYRYFLQAQENSIAFLGYDFSGVGGTVYATKALAEGLLEKGYMLRMFTCKQMKAWNHPAGAPMHPMYFHYRRHLIDRIKVKAIRGKWHYSHLKNDPACAAMAPVSGLGMKYWMKNIHANTVVSTRESLHLFLEEATSPLIKNKVYFFHSPSDWVGSLFPGVMEKLSELELDKVVFVTETNRDNVLNKYLLTKYQKSCVLGNAVDSTRCVTESDIRPTNKKDTLCFCVLLRINSERVPDIDRMLQFAEYLKKMRVDDISIDVYGDGDYKRQFVEMLKSRELGSYIHYRGLNSNVRSIQQNHDGAIDFSANQSFGMVYIETILNGKMVFCRHNEGSDEVLADIPECFYETDRELLEKLYLVKNESVESRRKRYEIIQRKYSREVVSDRFVDLISNSTLG